LSRAPSEQSLVRSTLFRDQRPSHPQVIKHRPQRQHGSDIEQTLANVQRIDQAEQRICV